MKRLATIREKDVDPSRENLPDEAFIKLRRAVKFVLFDDENKIAVIYHPAGDGHPRVGYYFPGGGVDEGEDFITALKREAKEETGCELKDITEIGSIVEYQNSAGKFRRQEVFVFTAKVLGEKGELEMTDNEKARNLELHWLLLEDIIAKLKDNLPSMATARAKIIIEAIKKLA